MSRPGGRKSDVGKEPRKRSPDQNKSRPSVSQNDSKELYSFTPNWITPQEKAKLKARVQRMKLREHQSMMKENLTLLQASKKGSVESTASKSKGKDKKSTSSEPEEGAKLEKTKSQKSVKSDKSRKSDKSGQKGAKKEKSKESMKKSKSKDSLRKSKSRDSMKSKGSVKSEKRKSKEDLRMAKKHQTKDKRKAEHANPSGNTMEKKPQRELKTNKLDEHLWASNYTHFDPQLYHFKSPEKLSTKNPVLAECPPFWVLLDHTIAVTWKLFSPEAERKDLGIIPLQWSREFVSLMRDERGEYLPATAQLLSAIEDALIDRYAKAGVAEEKAKPHKDAQQDSVRGPGQKEQDSLSYVSSENIFKHPVEVSYTLKDIMSRNMPGRKMDGKEGGVQCIVDPAVPKNEVPPPDDHGTMSKSDMFNYLKQLKLEQDLRVEKEKEHAHKIAALMELLANKKVSGDPWVDDHDSKKKHDGDHVHFDRKDNVDHDDVSGDRKRSQETERESIDMKSPSNEGKKKGKTEEGKKNEKANKRKSSDSSVASGASTNSKSKKGKGRKKSDTSVSSTSSTQSKTKKGKGRKKSDASVISSTPS